MDKEGCREAPDWFEGVIPQLIEGRYMRAFPLLALISDVICSSDKLPTPLMPFLGIITRTRAELAQETGVIVKPNTGPVDRTGDGAG